MFDDIIYVISKACEEKLRKAVCDSTGTIESVTEQLKNCDCTDIQLLQLSKGQQYITGHCTVNFTANELEGIAVPFARQVSIDVVGCEIENIFFGPGAIAVVTEPDELIDIDFVHQIYSGNPACFDINLFCN